jgi:hypothetical protein
MAVSVIFTRLLEVISNRPGGNAGSSFPDSKVRFRALPSAAFIFGGLIEKIRFAPDSPLEEDGFELVVPLQTRGAQK